MADGDTLRTAPDPPVRCATCGRPLGEDPDDSLDAGDAGEPICGDCYRTREAEAILEARWYDDHD